MNFKKTLIVSMLVSLILTIIIVTLANFAPKSKYTIYAAEHIYHTNEFNISGNTIYFRDVNKKNVCINGNYTLIYETEEKN